MSLPAGTHISNETGIITPPKADTATHVQTPTPPVTPPATPTVTDDTVRANQAAAAKLGVKIPGVGERPPTNTTTSTGSAFTSSTSKPDSSSQNKTISDTQKELDRVSSEYFEQAKSVQTTITNIANGITPLTPGEQAQVDGLKSQFDTLIAQQKLTNSGATGLAQIRGYQTGAAEYDPNFQVKTIAAIVSAGQSKLSDLQVKEASALAELTTAFQNNKISAVKDAWSIYKDAAKARQDQLQKTVDDTQKAIKDAQDTYVKQQTYELDVAKFNQTADNDAFDNAFKTEQEAFNEKDKLAQLAVDRFKAGMDAATPTGAPTQSATLGANGSPDPVSQAQVLDQISQTYGPMTAVAIKSLANYEMNPTDWSSRTGGKGMTREQAVTLAKMVDPTYNDAMYTTRATYMKNLASSQTGTVGSAINAANKSINHLTAFVTTMGQIPNGNLQFVNKINNTMTVADQRRAQLVSKAETEGLGVAEELAKFFKGSGTVDVASIEAWKKQLSTSATPGQVQGLTQGAIDLLAGQLETLAEQYKATMGKEPETDFIGASARASLSSLKNQGFQVDIPGINYTDKNAYIKNDPEAQSNMQEATKRLQAVGQPLTPENILQMAQSLDTGQSFNNVGGDTQAASSNKGIIGGYDINSYATDPTHEAKVSALWDRYQTVKSIPEISAAITRVAPNSPVTAQDIMTASSTTGVPPGLILAIMQQDSSFGTAGKAVRTKNPGNVGNTDSGATQSFKTWAEGVMAVARNLAKRKVA